MASLKFRHYATESALKGNGTVQNALNAFDVGTIVFIDDTQKQYIITSKSNNVVTYKIYYGKAAVVGVSGTDAARILTFSDGSEIKVTINNVEHATSSDTANSAKSVDWANVINTPNLVTTDTEQTITGVKIFNNNTTFKNETDVESLTADSLLVTGSARFTNTINGNLKGNVEGNLAGNATTATTAATATEFSVNKDVTLTGDVTGSASSKGGWSIATTIADGAVTNAKLANSKITIAGTEVNLGGSIAASTIGNALTSDAPAAYATNAGTATKAGEADKATKDSDGNVINTTYLKRSGGTVTGALILNDATTVNSTLTANNITADNLTVNGAAKFNGGLEGNLKGDVDGNATTATTCTGNATTATTATNLANKPSGLFTAATSSTDASLTITAGGKTSDAITIGKIKSAFTADSATTATSCSGNAETATTLQNTRKINGTDFNGSADITTSKWGTARNITISDGTNSGTATSVDGSGAITLNLPGTIKANLSGNASTATKATNADRATGDSDGNAINTTYLKRSGGTVTGNVTFNSSVTADSITAEDLIVNGAGRFVSGITGDLVGNVTGNVTGNLSGNASSATNATNDGSGNTITSTYATKTERSNNDITAASLNATKLTLTRAAGNITANIPTWNQDTTGTAAKATADAKGNNIINTYATKAEVAALPKSMVIKGTLDATHALPTSGMTEGDTYIVGASGTYNNIDCKVGDFFVRTSNDWLRVPAGDEWEYDENTIKAIKVNNAVHADTAGTASSVAWAGITGIPDLVTTDAEQTITGNKSFKNETSIESLTADSLLVTGPARFTNNIQGNLIGNVTGYLTGNISGSSTSCSGNADNATKDGSGNNIVNTYARIDKVYDDSGSYRQFLGKNGSSSDWVRTTESGIIPYISGDASNGHCSLGTSSWYFSKAYIQNIYGYLNGNISGSSTSCSGNSATATSATRDGNGNIIADTYLPLSGGTLTGTLTLPNINITSTASSLPSHYYHYLYGNDNTVYEHFGSNSDRNKITYGHFRFFDGNGSYKTLALGGDSTFNWDGHTVLTDANFNYYSPTLTGAGASGTWGISISGNAATATDADTLDGYHASSLVKFYLSPMSSGAPADSAKSWFVNTMPSASGAIIYNVPGSEKTIIAGKSSGPHGHMLQLNYEDNYLRILRYSSGNWKTDDWEKISAGHADTATVATTATTAVNDGNGNAIASTYLPLSGGTMTGNLSINTNDIAGFTIYRNNSIHSAIHFYNTQNSQKVDVGYLGVVDNYKPVYINSGGDVIYLLHSGNYNSYSPTLTGTGATGTWGIDISGNANTATTAVSAGSATKATQDSDGNIINTTYLKRSGGTVTGNVTFNSSVTTDSLTTEDLIVNGAARFVSGLTGDLVGNVTGNLTGTASYATNAGSATNAGTATTSGACTGNAATATKLQTARTIWGQSFDGSGNVDGQICINVSSSQLNNYNEGIRCNLGGRDNWASVVLGGASGSVSGSGSGVYSLLVNSSLFRIRQNNTDVLCINTSDNVGIGTTSPTSKLHVAGTGYFASDVSSASNIIAGGYIKGETVKISSGCTLEYSSTDKCVRFVFN